MCLTDEVLSAFPGAVGGGEDLPPSSCGDVFGNLPKGKRMDQVSKSGAEADCSLLRFLFT